MAGSPKYTAEEPPTFFYWRFVVLTHFVSPT
jgi:hypothetical protein